MKKVLIYTAISLVLILSALYVYVKSVIESFSVRFDLSDFNIKDLSFNSLDVGKGTVEVKLKFIIKFFSFFNISFSDLNLKAYYKNDLVAQSSSNSENKKEVTIISGVDNSVYHTFDVRVNGNTINLIYQIQNKLNYTINYELSLKVFGIQVNYKGTYTNK